MKTRGTLRSGAAALAACGLLLAASGAEADELRRSVPVAAGGTLYLELDRGQVDLVPSDGSEVRIEAVARGLGASSVHFDLRSEGNDLVLTGRADEWLAFLRRGPRVRVRAWVPREFGVEVRSPLAPHRSAMRNSSL